MEHCQESNEAQEQDLDTDVKDEKQEVLNATTEPDIETGIPNTKETATTSIKVNNCCASGTLKTLENREDTLNSDDNPISTEDSTIAKKLLDDILDKICAKESSEVQNYVETVGGENNIESSVSDLEDPREDTECTDSQETKNIDNDECIEKIGSEEFNIGSGDVHNKPEDTIALTDDQILMQCLAPEDNFQHNQKDSKDYSDEQSEEKSETLNDDTQLNKEETELVQKFKDSLDQHSNKVLQEGNEINNNQEKMQSAVDSTDPGSLNSSINRSKGFEKLLRKQLAGGDGQWTGDPELESIITDPVHRSPYKERSDRNVKAHDDKNVENIPERRTNRDSDISSQNESHRNSSGLVLRPKNTTSYDDVEYSRTHDTHREHVTDYRDVGHPSSRTNSAATERHQESSKYSVNSKDVNASSSYYRTEHRISDKYPESPEIKTSSRSTKRDYSETSRVSFASDSSHKEKIESRDKSREPSPSRRDSSPTRVQEVTSRQSDKGHWKPRNANEERQRIKDLEETESSLKQLLRDRDQEVDSLRKRNRTLQDRLEQAGTDTAEPESKDQHLNRDLEHQVNDLIRDKENLKTEIFQLRQELRERSLSKDSDSSSQERDYEVIGKYTPNNPIALQRKIDELQSHVQDLTEASESAGRKFHKAEEELTQLKEENENLRVDKDINLGDLQRENKRLRERVSMLAMEHPERDRSLSSSTGSEGILRQEIAELRTELRALRDKNHYLNEDNIHLRDRLVDLGATIELPTKDYSRDRVTSYATRTSEEKGLSSRSREIPQLTTPPRRSYRDEMRTRDYETHSLRSYDQRSDISESRRSVGVTRDDALSETRQYVYSRADDALARSLEHRQGSRSLSLGRNELLNSDRAPAFTTRSSRSSSRTTSPNRARISRIDVEDYPRSSSYLRSSERFKDDPRGSTYLNDSKSPTPGLTNGYSTLPRDYKYREKSRRNSRERELSSNSQELGYTYQRANKTRKFRDDVDKERSYVAENRNQRDSYREMNGELTSKYTESPPERKRDFELSPVNKTFAEENNQDAMLGFEQKLAVDLDNDLDFDLDDELAALPLIGKQRSDSMGSTNTDLILSEAQESLHTGDDQRPISPKLYDLINDQLGLRPTPPSTPPPLPPHGHRTVVPQPMVTQHNKHVVGIQRQNTGFSTSGLQPFAPRTASDIDVDNIVKFCRDGGQITRGQVKYVGHLPGKNQVYLGIELEREDGKHDGEYEGQRYFTSKPNRGIFVSFDKVVMAWGNR